MKARTVLATAAWIISILSQSAFAQVHLVVKHPSGSYAQVNGARLWYETEGQGEPLILIAGGPGDSHAVFHPFFSRLADSRRVVYFDAFGVGKSSRARSKKEYSFARDVEDLEGLRKAL